MNNNVFFLDEVLESLGHHIVSESPFFVYDYDISNNDFTRIVSSNSNSLPMMFDFSIDGINVHLSQVSEVFSWNNSCFNKQKDEISKIFTLLLTSDVQVFSYSKKYEKFLFKDVKTGGIIKIIRAFDGFFFNPFNKIEKNYSAVIK